MTESVLNHINLMSQIFVVSDYRSILNVVLFEINPMYYFRNFLSLSSMCMILPLILYLLLITDSILVRRNASRVKSMLQNMVCLS
jgi:hypothetical protein